MGLVTVAESFSGAAQAFPIASGHAGGTGAVDLGGIYAYLRIYCQDATGIAPNTTLRITVGLVDGETRQTVLSPETGAEYTPVLPGTGTFVFAPAFLIGARFVTLTLSVITTQAVVLYVQGIGKLGR